MPTYTQNMPLPKQSLGITQPLVNTNFQTIYDVFAINHFEYDKVNFGRHKFVEMPISGGGAGTIPLGLIANEGTIYTKTGSNATDLFYTNDASGNEYQLTRTRNSKFPLFATNTVYDGGIPQLTGGWTFLPGGMLLQYGTYSKAPASLSSTQNSPDIPYPFSFSTGVFSLVISMEGASGSPNIVAVTDKSSLSKFKWQFTGGGSTSFTGFDWIAIGV